MPLDREQQEAWWHSGTRGPSPAACTPGLLRGPGTKRGAPHSVGTKDRIHNSRLLSSSSKYFKLNESVNNSKFGTSELGGQANQVMICLK